MNDFELRAWALFLDAVKNFLGNRQAENYKKLVEKLLKSLSDKNSNMSIFFFLPELFSNEKEI